MKRIGITLGILAVLAASAAGGYWYWTEYHVPHEEVTYATVEEAENVYVRLAMEAYDVIMENYWQEVDDASLAEHYRLSLAKVSEADVTLATTTRAGVATMLDTTIDGIEGEERKRTVTLETIMVALYNLAPAGRSQLYTQTDEVALRNDVANINPEKNLYDDLGLEEGANVAAVQAAFEAKREELASATSSEAQAELARAEYAKEVLANAQTKAFYDEAKIEPTVTARTFGSETLYIDIESIAPTSLQEMVNQIAAATASSTMRNLIIDLRGNEGGALDFAAYMLGVFIGPNQYAADLFHQGEREPVRTPEQIPRIAELQGFDEIVFLTDEQTQSTAELTTAIFKRQNLATVVGMPTKGWGTVENTFPLETTLEEGESYLLYLVHRLTLRDDQEPIEGRGVDPHVRIDDPEWTTNLAHHVRSEELRDAVVTLIGEAE